MLQELNPEHHDPPPCPQAAASPAGSASAPSGSSRILRSGERTSQSTASVPPVARSTGSRACRWRSRARPPASDPSGRTP